MSAAVERLEAGVPCTGCGRAPSAHWVRSHWRELDGFAVCNLCRSSNVPIRDTKLHPLTGKPLLLSGEPKSGSVWNDPFIKTEVATG